MIFAGRDGQHSCLSGHLGLSRHLPVMVLTGFYSYCQCFWDFIGYGFALVKVLMAKTNTDRIRQEKQCELAETAGLQCVSVIRYKLTAVIFEQRVIIICSTRRLSINLPDIPC